MTVHTKPFARRATLVAALALFALVTASCQNTYEDMFLDPEGSTNAEIQYLFTQALADANMRLGYWEGYYQVYRDLAQWSQITGTADNGEDMMDIGNDQRWADLWNGYYTAQMMRVREMQRIYRELPEAQKEENRMYLVLGKILTSYNTALITDLWGDMPYTEAFQARAEDPAERNIFPAYDSQEAIYTAFLDSLQQASATLASGDVAVPPNLETQDIFLNGDLEAWQRFANGLRLRHGMRMSEVAPGRAEEIVSDVLEGGGPLVESNEENVVWEQTEEFNSFDARGQAVRESTPYLYAPAVMLGIMQASEDPRVPVFFDPNWDDGEYVGLPSSPDEQPGDISRDQFAYVDSVMFGQHSRFPGHLVTAAEVSLLEAEAYLRGWASGDAEAAYNEGLRQSVEMYYDVYNTNPNASSTLDAPSQGAVSTFLESEPAAFDDTSFEAGFQDIAVQRYVHFNHTQPYQAWATLRRTGYPELPPDVLEGGRALERTIRLTYPTSELSNNRENYQTVEDQDTRTTPLWWDVD